jgi:DNA repair protein RadD
VPVSFAKTAELFRSLGYASTFVDEAISLMRNDQMAHSQVRRSKPDIVPVLLEPAAHDPDLIAVALRESLFPYQKHIVDTVMSQSRTATNRQLVVMPTGAGKTRTAISIIFSRYLQTNPPLRSVLWLSPSTELVQQSYDAIIQLYEDLNLSFGLNLTPIGGKQPLQFDGLHIECGTLQLAYSRLRRRAHQYDLIIFDEAHLYTGLMGHKLLDIAAETDIDIIGLTATPGKTSDSNSWDFARIFNNRIIIPQEMNPDPIKFLEHAGVRSRALWQSLPLPAYAHHIRMKSLSGPAFNQSVLAFDPERFRSMCESLLSLRHSRKAIVFCASVEHVYALLTVLKTNRFNAFAITSETESAKRNERIQNFRLSPGGILLNINILAAGLDIPSITDAYFSVPIRSSVKWEQMIGRVTRGPKVGGTETAEIWEFDDHQLMHQGVLSFNRFVSHYT